MGIHKRKVIIDGANLQSFSEICYILAKKLSKADDSRLYAEEDEKVTDERALCIQFGTIYHEKRMALLQEYLSSEMSKYSFEKEKGLSHKSISSWLRIFAVEDKPVVSAPQPVVMDMKKDPNKEELLQEID